MKRQQSRRRRRFQKHSLSGRTIVIPQSNCHRNVDCCVDLDNTEETGKSWRWINASSSSSSSSSSVADVADTADCRQSSRLLVGWPVSSRSQRAGAARGTSLGVRRGAGWMERVGHEGPVYQTSRRGCREASRRYTVSRRPGLLQAPTVWNQRCECAASAVFCLWLDLA